MMLTLVVVYKLLLLLRYITITISPNFIALTRNTDNLTMTVIYPSIHPSIHSSNLKNLSILLMPKVLSDHSLAIRIPSGAVPQAEESVVKDGQEQGALAAVVKRSSIT